MVDKILFGVFSSWGSKVVSILLNLVAIPIFINLLGKTDSGYLYLLGNVGLLCSILDFGARSTFEREVALVFGSKNEKSTQRNFQRGIPNLNDLFETGKYLFLLIAFFSFFSSCVFGYFFIGSITTSPFEFKKIGLFWILVALSSSILVAGYGHKSTLRGCGFIGWDILGQTFISLLSLFSQIIFVYFGSGLITIGVIKVIESLSFFLFTYVFTYKKLAVFLNNGKVNIRYVTSSIAISLKSWLTSIGAFLVLRTDHFFIARYVGVEEIPVYHALYQLVSNIYSISVAISANSGVFVSQLWSQRRLGSIHSLLKNNYRFSMGIMLGGVSFIFFNCVDIISLWLSITMEDTNVITIFCVLFVLELNHVIFAYFSRATRYERFYFTALLAAVLNLIVSFKLVKRFGVEGVAMATVFSQIVTSNWYVPYMSLNRLTIKYKDYFKSFVLPVLIYGVLLFGMQALWASMDINGIPKWTRLVISFCISLIGMGVFLYKDSSQLVLKLMK